MSQFDFVLMLILGEATQQALLGDDFSMINCLVCVTTLISVDVLMSIAKARLPGVNRWIDGLPIVLIRHGRKEQRAMREERVDEHEILEQARVSHGIERLEQVNHAVLEKSGQISVVPREGP
jgi:uncharacterized membrane protein YcaP (DUF421 family)